MPRRKFFLSWLGALGAYALSFAYLLQRATAWGRRLTLVWIEDALFCVWFEYAVLETLRVLLTFVVLPMFLQHRMRSAEMRKMRRFPFSERFLDSPVARVLAAQQCFNIGWVRKGVSEIGVLRQVFAESSSRL